VLHLPPELANKFMSQFPDQEQGAGFNELKEIVVVDSIKKVPYGKFPYFVSIDKKTLKPINISRETLDVFHTDCIDNGIEIYKNSFTMYVWASDADEANKVAFEKLNKYLSDRR